MTSATPPSSQDTVRMVREAAVAMGFPPEYEADQFAYFCDVLAGAERFIDVGANHGIYSYIANRLMKRGTIALVEANPQLADMLRDEIKKWPADNGNTLEVFGLAAGDRSETLPFFLGELDTLGSLSRANEKGSDRQKISIRCEPLDNVFQPRPKTLIKVDVEGFEYRVLSGARRLIEGDTGLIVEMHGWGDPDRGRYPYHVICLMRRLGFSIARIGRSHTYYFVRRGEVMRELTFMRRMPIQGMKYVLRQSGLRPLISRLMGRKPSP